MPLWGSQRLCEPFLGFGDIQVAYPPKIEELLRYIYAIFVGRFTSLATAAPKTVNGRAIWASFGADFCLSIFKQDKEKVPRQKLGTKTVTRNSGLRKFFRQKHWFLELFLLF